ncbi:MAG: carboxylating nicotinate-nucleotide diphosphorylase [Chloroflexi bacterium]|nr:carboxylating nicotinate-nucleotide diphosphorylase [Chloroflexota bacterium]
MVPTGPNLERIIDDALEEDLALGDPTTSALIPSHLTGRAKFVTRQAGILAGIDVAFAVCKRVDAELRTKAQLLDGDVVEPGSVLGTVEGKVASILTAERTALNFLQRMSGIATLTGKYVAAVRGTNATIVDTRKTAPGLRSLDKYAVASGGGKNHRMCLGDGIMIKDNHVAALRAEGVSLTQVVRRARTKAPHTLKIEVEVESVVEAQEALKGGADIILADNMGVEELRKVVELARGAATVEASGGITLDNVKAVAATGVDLVSIGALTHSVVALDIGLDYES